VQFELGINNFQLNSTLSFTLLDSKLNSILTTHYALQEGSSIITAFLPAELLLTGNYYIQPLLHIPNVRFLDKCDEMLTFRIEDTGSVHSFYNRSDLGIINLNPQWQETLSKK